MRFFSIAAEASSNGAAAAAAASEELELSPPPAALAASFALSSASSAAASALQASPTGSPPVSPTARATRVLGGSLAAFLPCAAASAAACSSADFSSAVFSTLKARSHLHLTAAPYPASAAGSDSLRETRSIPSSPAGTAQKVRYSEEPWAAKSLPSSVRTRRECGTSWGVWLGGREAGGWVGGGGGGGTEEVQKRIEPPKEGGVDQPMPFSHLLLFLSAQRPL